LRVSAGIRPDFPWTRGRACCHVQHTTFEDSKSKVVRTRQSVGPPARSPCTTTGTCHAQVMAWTWTLHDESGAETWLGASLMATTSTAADQVLDFESQGDAESFIGEVWRDLLAAGVDSVSLHDGDTLVYNMSLQPPTV
jgi:hypothetical protein